MMFASPEPKVSTASVNEKKTLTLTLHMYTCYKISKILKAD